MKKICLKTSQIKHNHSTTPYRKELANIESVPCHIQQSITSVNGQAMHSKAIQIRSSRTDLQHIFSQAARSITSQINGLWSTSLYDGGGTSV